MAHFKQSDRVREIVKEKYVRPALKSGNTNISIRVRDVLRDAEATADFPRGRTPMICNVLQSNKLLTDTGLEIVSVDGPPSRQSRTVVVHYRVAGTPRASDRINGVIGDEPAVAEDSAMWAKRVTGKLEGLLKEEMATYGGGDAFMTWIRSDGEDAA